MYIFVHKTDQMCKSFPCFIIRYCTCKVSIMMPISTSNMVQRLDDLERSVTFLADQNITLHKCLDRSNQLVSKLEQKLVILGEEETFIVFYNI